MSIAKIVRNGAIGLALAAGATYLVKQVERSDTVRTLVSIEGFRGYINQSLFDGQPTGRYYVSMRSKDNSQILRAHFSGGMGQGRLEHLGIIDVDTTKLNNFIRNDFYDPAAFPSNVLHDHYVGFLDSSKPRCSVARDFSSEPEALHAGFRNGRFWDQDFPRHCTPEEYRNALSILQEAQQMTLFGPAP